MYCIPFGFATHSILFLDTSTTVAFAIVIGISLSTENRYFPKELFHDSIQIFVGFFVLLLMSKISLILNIIQF